MNVPAMLMLVRTINLVFVSLVPWVKSTSPILKLEPASLVQKYSNPIHTSTMEATLARLVNRMLYLTKIPGNALLVPSTNTTLSTLMDVLIAN